MKKFILLYIFIIIKITTYGQVYNNKPFAILKGHKYKVENAFFSPNGKFILSYGWDNTIIVWNAKTFSQIKTLKGHSDQIWNVTISPDHKTIVSGSLDASFIIWDFHSGEIKEKVQLTRRVPKKEFIPELDRLIANSVYSVSIRNDGKHLAIASADKMVRIWDMKQSEFIDSLEGHTTFWTNCIYSPNGKYLITKSHKTYGFSGITLIWETDNYSLIGEINYSGGIFFTDDEKVGIRTDSCRMNFYNLSDANFSHKKKFPCLEGAFSISPNGKYVISGKEDYYLRLWNIETGSLIWQYRNEKMEVQQANFSPDGKYLIAGIPEGDVLIWRMIDITQKK